MSKKDFYSTVKKILKKRKTYRRIRSYHQRESAVLIPIFQKNNKYHVLFTKRAPLINYHQGHISFPGGVVEKKDQKPEETALREAHEEIGLLKKDVELLGPVDDSLTYVPPFVIHPYVGVIPYPYPFRLNPEEVEKIIEVPLDFFLPYADALDDWEKVDYEKAPNFPDFHYEGEHIWGTTASITANLMGILKNNMVFIGVQ
jgi:8-oxo-dGTP pyrophosphatase MutT (NUDIX family)